MQKELYRIQILLLEYQKDLYLVWVLGLASLSYLNPFISDENLHYISADAETCDEETQQNLMM